MTITTRRIAQALILLAAPVALFAFSSGPPIRRTGAPTDVGGQTCQGCHNSFALNSRGGRVVIGANGYTPGQKQNITIRIEDSTALRWGYQITARLASDETKTAGTFTATQLTRVRCAPDGREAPCNGDNEFAEQSADPEATRRGQQGPQTFVLEWTAPSRNLGPVVFYAAANAANNDGGRLNDAIYTSSVRVPNSGCGQPTKPAITPTTGIVDAASYRSTVSSNSLISIFGGPFLPTGVSYQATAVDLIDGKLPTDMACVAVEINGARVPIFFARQDQINAQFPIQNTTNQATVRVILDPGGPNEIASDPRSVNVNFYSPAWFTFNGRSIAARNASLQNQLLADPAVVPGGVFARPGDVVTLYGTGFGYTNPVFQPGEFAFGTPRLRDAYTVTIGSLTLSGDDILYAGLAPDAPGFYQFNLRVPSTAPDGDQPVVVRIGGQSTQAGTTIPVKR